MLRQHGESGEGLATIRTRNGSKTPREAPVARFRRRRRGVGSGLMLSTTELQGRNRLSILRAGRRCARATACTRRGSGGTRLLGHIQRGQTARDLADEVRASGWPSPFIPPQRRRPPDRRRATSPSPSARRIWQAGAAALVSSSRRPSQGDARRLTTRWHLFSFFFLRTRRVGICYACFRLLYMAQREILQVYTMGRGGFLSWAPGGYPPSDGPLRLFLISSPFLTYSMQSYLYTK